MNRRRITTMLLCALALALCACGIVPRGKTIVVERTRPPRTASPTAEGRPQFILNRKVTLDTHSLDQTGYYSTKESLVAGWLDDDHLLAIGVKPVAAEGETDTPSDPVDEERGALRAEYMNLTGQILSLDWETGEATELYTVQNEVFFNLALSHDRTRISYCSSGIDGNTKLSVSDISFKHSLLEVDSYYGYPPVWSSHDRLLAYQGVKATLTVFDNVKSIDYAGMKFSIDNQPLALLDDTDEVVFLHRDSLLTIYSLGLRSQTGESKELLPSKLAPYMEMEIPNAGKQVIAGNDYLLSLSKDYDSIYLQVQNIRTAEMEEGYRGVMNFALSGDGQYVCLVRGTESGSADVYVAEWRNGRIVNEKLVYKGFLAYGNIHFSPENTKLYLEGTSSYLDMEPLSLILEFK